ncbi:hypothetical protein L218DRAFT_946663 [Marasmius fiardii PR-910]|nr:hypothetical protein L218DRAFT_946663 [Marasmius fiardii PR-910]
MQRVPSSLKIAQKTFTRSLATSPASRQPTVASLPLEGAMELLPRFAGVFDTTHNLRVSLDSGLPKTGLVSDFHDLPAPTVFDGPARRPRVHTLWPACHLAMSQTSQLNQGVIEIFDGPSHYHRSHYGPPPRKEKNPFVFVLGATVIGGGVFLSLN